MTPEIYEMLEDLDIHNCSNKCNYVLVSKNVENSIARKHAACLRGIDNYNYDQKYWNLFFVYNNTQGVEYNKNTFEYLNWVLNESIWSDVFLTKDPEEVYQKGVFSSTDFPVEFVVQANMVIRYIFEFNRNAKAFLRFKKYIPGILALILSADFQERNKLIIYRTVSNTNHVPFSYGTVSINKKIILNMLNNDRKYFEDTMKERTSYDCISNIWSSVEYEKYHYDSNRFSYPTIKHFIKSKGLFHEEKVEGLLEEYIEEYLQKILNNNNGLLP